MRIYIVLQAKFHIYLHNVHLLACKYRCCNMLRFQFRHFNFSTLRFAFIRAEGSKYFYTFIFDTIQVSNIRNISITATLKNIAFNDECPL